MAFTYPQDGIDDVLAAHLTQILDAWTGATGKGIPLTATAINDPINFAIAARNLDATNSRAAQFLKADGTVLFQVDASGVKLSIDGTTAGIPLTTTGTQTLTNKTLTNPVINGTVTGTGGFNGNNPWPGTVVITQGANTPTFTTQRATYVQIGKLVQATLYISPTAAGLAANDIVISPLPSAPAYTNIYSTIGTFTYFRAAAAGNYTGSVVAVSSTNVKLVSSSNGTVVLNGYLGNTGGPSFAVANGDIISLSLCYEAA